MTREQLEGRIDAIQTKNQVLEEKIGKEIGDLKNQMMSGSRPPENIDQKGQLLNDL